VKTLPRDPLWYDEAIPDLVLSQTLAVAWRRSSYDGSKAGAICHWHDVDLLGLALGEWS
jgi:hypothetical protein